MGPTTAAAVQDGVRVTVPVPVDTVFVTLRAGPFDAAVAMDHDQALIPATGKWDALSG